MSRLCPLSGKPFPSPSKQLISELVPLTCSLDKHWMALKLSVLRMKFFWSNYWIIFQNWNRKSDHSIVPQSESFCSLVGKCCPAAINLICEVTALKSSRTHQGVPSVENAVLEFSPPSRTVPPSQTLWEKPFMWVLCYPTLMRRIWKYGFTIEKRHWRFAKKMTFCEIASALTWGRFKLVSPSLAPRCPRCLGSCSNKWILRQKKPKCPGETPDCSGTTKDISAWPPAPSPAPQFLVLVPLMNPPG